MKSIAIEAPRSSGTGKGCNGPIGRRVDDLFRWQSRQLGT